MEADARSVTIGIRDRSDKGLGLGFTEFKRMELNLLYPLNFNDDEPV